MLEIQCIPHTPSPLQFIAHTKSTVIGPRPLQGLVYLLPIWVLQQTISKQLLVPFVASSAVPLIYSWKTVSTFLHSNHHSGFQMIALQILNFSSFIIWSCTSQVWVSSDKLSSTTVSFSELTTDFVFLLMLLLNMLERPGFHCYQRVPTVQISIAMPCTSLWPWPSTSSPDQSLSCWSSRRQILSQQENLDW
jgi:hypothetical protein